MAPRPQAPEAAETPSLRRRLVEAETRDAPLLLRAAIVGALAGLLGGAFRLLLTNVETLHRGLTAAPGVWSWLVPAGASALLVTAAVFLVRRFAPETRGSGIPEVEASLDGEMPLRWWRVLPVKFGAGLMAIGAGLVLGREGPTIQMGGAAGRAVASFRDRDRGDAHVLVAAGAGAGLAAAFNAPFAGILFVVEEMRPHFRYGVLSLHAVIIACIAADIVVRLMLGGGATMAMPTVEAPPLSSLWIFLILGALFGGLGVVFNRLMLGTVTTFGRLPGSLWIVGALAIGAGSGLLVRGYPAVTGEGHRVIGEALAGAIPVAALLGVFLARFATTLLSYGSGAPGGIFAPMLALATVLSLWLGHYAHAWMPDLIAQPAVLAVAGMGAMFAAAVRAPLTGIILTVEITASFELILPLTLTCVTATIVAQALGGRPIYTQLLEQSLAHRAAIRG